jgi:hypothetical protein
VTVAVFIFALIAGNLICGDTAAGISTQRSSARNVLMILTLIPIPANSMKTIPTATVLFQGSNDRQQHIGNRKTAPHATTTIPSSKLQKKYNFSSRSL